MRQIDKELAKAKEAVEHAKQTRAYHRRQTARDSVQRRTDVRVARKKLKEAMKPLRSRLISQQYRIKTKMNEQDEKRVREASYRIQRERQKLHKLVPKENNESN